MSILSWLSVHWATHAPTEVQLNVMRDCIHALASQPQRLSSGPATVRFHLVYVCVCACVSVSVCMYVCACTVTPVQWYSGVNVSYHIITCISVTTHCSIAYCHVPFTRSHLQCLMFYYRCHRNPNSTRPPCVCARPRSPQLQHIASSQTRLRCCLSGLAGCCLHGPGCQCHQHCL